MGFEIELWYILRIFMAAVLGFVIGIERKMRSKEAGMRTHAMVCLGSCLLMIVSKYGFEDVGNYDAARIASQIVTGIGFIGAGMILYRQRAIHGLTTAAGIWVTAGIGMAIGAGQYHVALGGTIVMMLVQLALCLPLKFIKTPDRPTVKVVFECKANEDETLKAIFNIKDFSSCVISRVDGIAIYTAYFTLPYEIQEASLKNILLDNVFIRSIEKNEAVQ